MAIWQLTKARYENTDKRKPLPRWGSVRYPICLACGGMVIPLTSHNARCPKCDATVSWVRVPEDRVDEVRDEIRKA